MQQQPGVAAGNVPPPPPQQPPAYTIPPYNPANPQFAPPPSDQPVELPAGSLEEEPLTPPEKPPRPEGASNVSPTGASRSSPSGMAASPSHSHGSRWKDKLVKFGEKAAEPVNMLAHKLGAQSFLPMSMEKECEKAAAILRSFTSECFDRNAKKRRWEPMKAKKRFVNASEDGVPTVDASGAPQSPSHLTADGAASVGDKKKSKRDVSPRRALVTIPPKLIARAHGLAIFTVARVGFQVSGATGAGIVIARLPDGSWSAPSGIQVHSLGAGFLVGADIYDCVCILNTPAALAAFTNTRVSLGSDLAVAAGPWGAGGQLEWGRATAKEMPDGVNRHGEAAPVLTEGESAGTPVAGQDGDPQGKLRVDSRAEHKRSTSSGSLKPVFTYVRSRGLYAGVAVDGTVVTERKEANEKFYGVPGIDVETILHGKLPQQAREKTAAATRSLMEAIKLAEVLPAGRPTSSGGPPPSPGAAQSYQPQVQPQGQPHQNVPGVVSVPLHRVEKPLGHMAPPAYDGPAAAGPSTAGPSTAGPSTAGPSTAGPSTAGGESEELPSYSAGEGWADYVPDQKVSYH